MKGVDVVENELVEPTTMPAPFGSVLRSYYETLKRYRLLTYGQQIARAVSELQRPELAPEVHGKLRHLIVVRVQFPGSFGADGGFAGVVAVGA